MAEKSKAARNLGETRTGKGTINLKAAIYTIFITLTVSCVLCILAGLLFGWKMYEAWIPLLPGFIWPVNPLGFLIGLIWIIGYSVYFGILISLPYNFFLKRQ